MEGMQIRLASDVVLPSDWCRVEGIARRLSGLCYYDDEHDDDFFMRMVVN